MYDVIEIVVGIAFVLVVGIAVVSAIKKRKMITKRKSDNKVNKMKYLENYYNNYDEDGRLLSQHGQVEYRTTMKYIHDMITPGIGAKILEVGAGTGRYSIQLANENYDVDAVELIPMAPQIICASA